MTITDRGAVDTTNPNYFWADVAQLGHGTKLILHFGSDTATATVTDSIQQLAAVYRPGQLAECWQIGCQDPATEEITWGIIQTGMKLVGWSAMGAAETLTGEIERIEFFPHPAVAPDNGKPDKAASPKSISQ